MPTEWMRPTRSTESDSTRASWYSYATARPPFSARNTNLTRVLYVVASSDGTNPFLIGAITLKSDVPAMPPVLIVKSRRMSLSPCKRPDYRRAHLRFQKLCVFVRKM